MARPPRTEKQKEARRLYNASDRGRAAQKRQNASVATRKAQVKYNATDKRRVATQRYLRSEKGRKAQRSTTTQRYGLTVEAWDALFAQQGFSCAACGSLDPGRKNGHWSTDHDHAREDTHVRAILCSSCNLSLGLVKDNIPRLQALIGYLERYNDGAS